jgi:murein L,D-transpeptidase YafK
MSLRVNGPSFGGACRVGALVALCVLLVCGGTRAVAESFEYKQKQRPRVRDAFLHHATALAVEFAKAGAAWPPTGIFLRGFKHEGELELWARKIKPSKGNDTGERVLVRTFPICAASGVLGPKVRAGDYQVPEGFYTIDRFNPNSSYHLSLGVNYPNAVDKARAAGHPPGGDIFIHGSCVTIGCLPLEDDPIEALYVTAVMAKSHGQGTLPVHLFPCRFGQNTCEAAMRKAAPDAALTAFWEVLREGYLRFENGHLPPRVRATAQGYRIE